MSHSPSPQGARQSDIEEIKPIMTPSRRLPVWLLCLSLGACASPPPESEAQAMPPAPRFVLLGELHDNPQHHLERAQRVRELIAREPRTVVVVEQLERGQRLSPGDPAPLEERLRAAGFDAKSWRWPLHEPLFAATLAAGAPLQGGNLPREQVRRIVREGDAAWPTELLALRQASAWDESRQQRLQQEIQDGHCGAMPVAMLPGMVQAQRARDAALAAALLETARQGARQVVLIAGNGHVRRDLAVPLYLQAAGVPAWQIRVVAYLEPDSAVPAQAYDAVERAPAPKREDPCAAFQR